MASTLASPAFTTFGKLKALQNFYSMAFLMRPASKYVMENGHQRQPFFIEEAGYDAWMEPGERDPKESLAILREYVYERPFDYHARPRDGRQLEIDRRLVSPIATSRLRTSAQLVNLGFDLIGNHIAATNRRRNVEETNEELFAWTFPVYIVGANLVLRPDGELLITKDSDFAAEELEGVGHLPVFTDRVVAERYRQSWNEHRAWSTFRAVFLETGLTRAFENRATGN